MGWTASNPTEPERWQDWQPSPRTAIVIQAVAVALAVVGLVGYGAIAIRRYAVSSFELDPGQLLIGMVLTAVATVVLVVVHEAVHGLAMLPFGARPRFGVGMAARVLPYAYATAPGHRFARAAYVLVAIAPTIVVNLLTVALVARAPYGGWLVLAAAIHLAGCVGDWWLVAVALRQPPGCCYEDLRSGLRVHLPEESAAE